MFKDFVTLAEVAEAIKLNNIITEIDISKVRVYHRIVNRPQFFISGFEEPFEKERLQLFGMMEMNYLLQFTSEEKKQKFERLCATGIPGIIICRGIEAWPELVECARKYKVPVLVTEQQTAVVMVNTVSWINDQLSPTTTLYGVLVDVYGEGILIMGDSGVGKSETALELVKRGHRLVADDMIEVKKTGEGRLLGQAPSLSRHFIELRGIGVVDVRSLYGIESVRDLCPIDMVICLEEWDNKQSYDRLGLKEEFMNILDVNVVKHTVPIRTGRNLSIIIETAAVNNRQKKMGYNAAEELCNRVSEEIRRKKAEREEEEQWLN